MGRIQLSRLLKVTARFLVRVIPVLVAIAEALIARPPKPKPPQ